MPTLHEKLYIEEQELKKEIDKIEKYLNANRGSKKRTVNSPEEVDEIKKRTIYNKKILCHQLAISLGNYRDKKRYLD